MWKKYETLQFVVQILLNLNLEFIYKICSDLFFNFPLRCFGSSSFNYFCNELVRFLHKFLIPFKSLLPLFQRSNYQIPIWLFIDGRTKRQFDPSRHFLLSLDASSFPKIKIGFLTCFLGPEKINVLNTLNILKCKSAFADNPTYNTIINRISFLS